MKSLRYDPSPLSLFDVGEQTFKYTVAAKPDSFNLQSVGITELDMRVVLGYTDCKNGLPANTLVVSPTVERYFIFLHIFYILLLHIFYNL